MKILGIDPGMAILGYCVLDYDTQNPDCCYEVVTSGSIQTCKTLKCSERLLEIHNDLEEIINTYKPEIAAVEKIFYFKNAKTIIPVSEARGVILMTLEMLKIPVFEYTPLEVKQTLTGYGRACKDEVKEMVSVHLSGSKLPGLDDTTDAIAIAMCQTMMCKNL